MARNSRKKNRRGGTRRKHGQGNIDWKVIALGAGAVILLGGAGYLIASDAMATKVAANGCYPSDNKQSHTVALIDASDPRFDVAQTRDLNEAFDQLYTHELDFNEQVAVITTGRDVIGSVPKPRLVFCRGARTGAELEAIGAASATEAFLTRESDEFKTETYDRVLSDIFHHGASPAESPILEQIQSISRMHEFGDIYSKRRLIIVSDFIQNTDEAQFCSSKGHLPSFEAFKRLDYFRKIKPDSLEGVDVRLYMLIRPGYSQGSYAYCTENELADFWTAFFKDAGASNVRIDRLRLARG